MARTRAEKLALLSSYIRGRVDAAKKAKIPHSRRMVECVSQVAGNLISRNDPDSEVEIKYNITAPIVRGVIALLRDIVGEHIETPFVVKSTPSPTLPKNIEEEVVTKIKAMVPGILAVGGTLDDVKARAVELSNVAYESLDKEADKAAKACAIRVGDKLIEGGFVNAFKDFLISLVYFPAAILKRSTVLKKVRQFGLDGVEYVYKPVDIIENINPLYVYPAPDAATLQSAEYIVEQRLISRMELETLKYIGRGYDKQQIKIVTDTMPLGYFEKYDDTKGIIAPIDPSDVNPLQQDPSFVAYSGENDTFKAGYYTLTGYYGLVKGDFLNLFGAEVDEDIGLEAEVWMIGDIPIMAKSNPVQSGVRPFFGTSFEKIPGNFWGECPVTRLTDLHKLCIATVKRMVRNIGFASGPTGEVTRTRLVNPDKAKVIPYNFVEVKPDPSGSKAFNMMDVKMIAYDLSGLVDKFVQWGYDAIGIPRMAVGSNVDLGSVGRTAGGMSMLLGQANKVIKQAIMDVEQDVIEPLVQTFIDDDILNVENAELVGDINAYARSFSGIVEREAQGEGLSWALQSLVPLAQSGQVSPEVLSRVVYQMFKAKKIPTEGIFPDFDLMSGVESATAKFQGNQMPAGGEPTGTGPNPPPQPIGGSPVGVPPSGVNPVLAGEQPGIIDRRMKAAIAADNSSQL